MATLGAELQHARELAGLSLDDLSARTKIRRPLLDAIEHDDYHAIPGGLLARGYLRAYAREVGLPPDTIAARYQTEFGTESPPLTDALKSRGDGWDLSRPAPSPGSVAVVILIAIFAGWLYYQQRADPSEGERPVGTAGRGSEPAGTSASPPADTLKADHTPGARPGNPSVLLTVEINPTRVVWVEATADGKRMLYALVTPDERRVLEAQQEVLLRVGDAGAFRYRVNGVEGREVGRPGEVREVRITRQNYVTFQKP